MPIHEESYRPRTCVLPFGGNPKEIAGLRRVVRLQLKVWGSVELAHAIALAVTELAANAITHAGRGAPATLVMQLDDARLRLELHDGSPQAPVVAEPSPEDECGRGLLILAAIASRWGFLRTTVGKAVWCEFALPISARRCQIQRASAALEFYGHESGDTALLTRSAPVHESAATGLITDVLCWLFAQGLDPESILHRAQAQFDGDSCRTSSGPRGRSSETSSPDAVG